MEKMEKFPPIKHMHADCLGVEGVSCDWDDIRGEDCEGFESFEVCECEECGTKFVLTAGQGEERHKDIDYDSKCEGWVPQASGPMMNYWYPIDIKDCQEAAKKIADLPLCVVEFKDGTTGLALTGGGMDLSWEICEAFMCLRQLPPVHFRLPAICDRGTSRGDRWIIAGMRKSLVVMKRRMTNDLRQLREMVAWAEKRKKEAERAAKKEG